MAVRSADMGGTDCSQKLSSCFYQKK